MSVTAGMRNHHFYHLELTSASWKTSQEAIVLVAVVGILPKARGRITSFQNGEV
jgi:hypothetical protein